MELFLEKKDAKLYKPYKQNFIFDLNLNLSLLFSIGLLGSILTLFNDVHLSTMIL